MIGLALPPGTLVGLGTMIAAVEFTGVVKLIAIAIGVLTGVGTIAGIVYGVRYKIIYEVEKKAREGAEALANLESKRGDRLDAELHRATTKLDEAVHELVVAHETIGRLENIPNVEAVVQLISEHEERALERHESIVAVLAGVAANLERLTRKIGAGSD